MHQFDPRHTGHNPDAVGVKSSPSRRWEFDTGADVNPNAGAMLVDKRLYIANEDGVLRGIRVDEGQEFWRFDMEATSVLTTPALGAEEGLVFAGGECAPLFAIDSQNREV
jgi:outer membrane protein assembly factor BamB